MLVSDLITDEVPPLKYNDTVDQALHWMEEFKVNHLAVIKGNELIGLVAESDLLDANSGADEEIGKINIRFIKPVIHQTQHAYDALKLMTGMNVTLLPVLDDKEKFAGSVTYKSALEKFTGFSAIQEPGGIIELEMFKNDYSLTQIAGIVEGNDAKILSLYVSSLEDSTKIEVTLKVNKEDLSRILQTFYRYNYNVKASYHQSDFEEDLKGRFNEFIRFLNI
jgi:acetoin utilization protein AcuB